MYLCDSLTGVLGRCSHICNAGFITTSVARGKGVGFAMGETYLEFAPKLVRIAESYSEIPWLHIHICVYHVVHNCRQC